MTSRGTHNYSSKNVFDVLSNLDESDDIKPVHKVKNIVRHNIAKKYNEPPKPENNTKPTFSYSDILKKNSSPQPIKEIKPVLHNRREFKFIPIVINTSSKIIKNNDMEDLSLDDNMEIQTLDIDDDHYDSEEEYHQIDWNNIPLDDEDSDPNNNLY